jgi:hypothetical protein
LFRKRNSTDVIAATGVRQKQAIRATFSEAEDSMIKSLQKVHGNKWEPITDRINATFETDRNADQVRHRFLQLEKEEKEGGRKLRRVGWTSDQDAQYLVLRDEYIKKNGTTWGVLDFILTKMQGKTKRDLKNRWERHLSKKSAATMTATTSTTTTLLTETSLETKAAATKVATTLTATTKVAVKKVAAKKVAPSSDSEQSDGYSSSDSETSDGYSSSEDESDTERSAPPQVIGGLSEYELLRAKNVARNNARLDMLGLGSVPKEAKKKVAKKRKSPPVDEPQRVLPGRKRNSKSYNEEYIEDVY